MEWRLNRIHTVWGTLDPEGRMISSVLLAVAMGGSLQAEATPTPGVTVADRSWTAIRRGCHLDALEMAAAGLRETPDDPGLHRVYSSIPAFRMRSRRAETLDHYRALAASHPDHPGVALGIAQLDGTSRPDCDALDSMLSLGDATDADLRYHQLRVRSWLARSCRDFDAEAIDAELADLGQAGHVEARAWTLQQQLKEDAGAADASEVRQLATEAPVMAKLLAKALWWHAGPGTAEHREVLVELADHWATSDEPVHLLAAADIYEAASRGRKAKRVTEALDESHPCEGIERSNTYVLSKLGSAILEADQRPTHEGALERLDAMAKKIPDVGPDRALWQRKRIARLEALERDDAVYDAMKELAQLLPDDSRVVNRWAWAAALRGEDLEEAEAAMGPVLQSALEDDWDGGDARSRAAHIRRHTANLYDTRAWVRYRLGRLDDARADIERGLLLAFNGKGLSGETAPGSMLAHAALIRAALGDDEPAQRLFQQAFAGGIRHDALRAEALERFEALYQTGSLFHPGGFEGLIAALEESEEPDEHGSVAAAPPSHPLVGEAFPVSTAKPLDGNAPIDLSHDGLLVVDVWATWCGPCIQGMPHLQEVAAEYADQDVRVVGLSVDQKQSAPMRFFKGTAVDYELGWIGAGGMQELSLSGIPALFVIRPDGTVAEMIGGYGAGDTRLERALDRELASTDAHGD